MDLFDNLTQNFNKFRSDQERKKNQDIKRDEMKKIYSYVGMEAFDLYKSGKLQAEELQVYFDRLSTLDREIREIDAIMEAERHAGETEVRYCSCGNVIAPGSKFCAYCGKPVRDDVPFLEEQQEDIPMIRPSVKTCICGAEVQDGQTICMACGRKVQ